jgi:demethylmenaquinone methyltransferase/2-methoxy-6-polyprenyl-1,4-benzoquinol methylase
MSTAQETPSRANVWQMFDRIAHRYDLLNHLLSFGTDIIWRWRAARRLSDIEDLELADIATGTCDMLLSILKRHKDFKSCVGVDMSAGMLELGQKKVENAGLADRVQLVRGDAVNLPLADATVNAVTISFGIRNVIDVPAGLREMRRVLRPGGRAVILEFSLPRNGLIRAGYLFYFRNILPLIGGLISGDSYAYNYLNKTVETFPYGDAFLDLMREAGFINVSASQLTFGVASIYVGEAAG